MFLLMLWYSLIIGSVLHSFEVLLYCNNRQKEDTQSYICSFAPRVDDQRWCILVTNATYWWLQYVCEKSSVVNSTVLCDSLIMLGACD